MIFTSPINKFFDTLILSQARDVLIVSMNKEKKDRNSLDRALIDDLESAFRFLAECTSFSSAVLCSQNPRTFSCGAKIELMLGATRQNAWEFVSRGQDLLKLIKYSKKPVVAAIDGMTLGGGFELALACTARVVAKSKLSQFGLPENKLGVLPAMGGIVHLTKMLGEEKASEWITQGKIVEIDEALKHELIDFVVPKEILLDHAAIVAKGLAGFLTREPAREEAGNTDYVVEEIKRYLTDKKFEVVNPAVGPIATALTLFVAHKCASENFGKGLAFEREAFAYLVGTKDAQEGIRALGENREPHFSGN
jgi:enoyl-CoA hydratase/carnithine racemase